MEKNGMERYNYNYKIFELKIGKNKIKKQSGLPGYDYFELKNGKGKIEEHYDNGELKFEGEYLNGLTNGKGKEYYKVEDRKSFKENNNSICYYKGKLEYEGEDLNEDYDTYSYDDYDAYNKGKLKYNGEYLYGLRNGKGKEYYKKGK